MAKLSLSLDERSLKNGMAQIRLRITNHGTNAFFGTGVYIEPIYFVKGSLYDPIRGKAYMAAEKREQVQRLVERFETFMAETGKVELDQLMASEIKALVLGAPEKKEVTKVADASQDFLKWFAEYGASRRTVKTQDSYAYGLKVLREYCDACKLWMLRFQDIDYARLADFARWLTSTGKGPATRHMLESYVRAAYKEAQKRHFVSRENDPYYDYSIKPIPTKEIECLTAKQMNMLMNVELPLMGMERARDIALISFYLCGANLLDLYEMQEPKNGEIVFVRHKIENGYDLRPLHIRIEPELKGLLKKYHGEGQMLSFKASYPNYESFRHKIAHRLREVSKVVGFGVSMARIRRSWATIAAMLEVPDRVIDKSMGHVDSSVKDKHYEQYEWSRTAAANRKIIDYIKQIEI